MYQKSHKIDLKLLKMYRKGQKNKVFEPKMRALKIQNVSNH